jgi:anti-sigma B factor antagonist
MVRNGAKMTSEQLTIEISTDEQSGAHIYRLRGSLDLATAPSVRAALVEVAAAGQHDIVVDLTQLEFLDSTGLGALIGAHRRALENGGNLRLAVGEGRIARLLNITGLMRVFPVYASLEDALAGQQRMEALA